MTFNMIEIKVEDTVMWLGSSYTIIKIANGKALLKQNFSIGTVLTEMVNLNDRFFKSERSCCNETCDIV